MRICGYERFDIVGYLHQQYEKICAFVKCSKNSTTFIKFYISTEYNYSRSRHNVTFHFRAELQGAYFYILLRGRGPVTNNNGFWIGGLNLLTTSFQSSLNHTQL
jgi:hypothetical protein